MLSETTVSASYARLRHFTSEAASGVKMIPLTECLHVAHAHFVGLGGSEIVMRMRIRPRSDASVLTHADGQVSLAK